MNDDDIDGGEFTEKERKRIRRIVRDQQRMDWMWATLRIWTGWLSAAIIGAYAPYEALVKFIFKKVGP